MADHDVPDSTDWLSTPLASLAAVESALRCQVCKDFFRTPMITTCSHTFCSLCIRRALSNEGKCPLCRAPEQELKLRSNWSVEEAVEAFVKARTATLEMARNHDRQTRTSKRKPVEDHHESGDAPDGKRLRSSSRLRNTRSTPSYTVPTEEEKIVEVPDSDDDFQPEPEDGLVACPVCQSRMKEWQVFKHLETCTGPTPKPRRTIAISSSSGYGQHRQQTSTAERLPAINYSMYKDQALRKKMSDLGISNQGPRPLLERRHKEWMTIWNSNCDAAQPRKHRELLHDLETWENTQGGAAPTTGRSARNAAIIKDKDFDGAAWAAKHDTSFKDLINHARQTRLEAKRKAEAAAKESKAEETATSLSQEPPRVDQLQPNHSTAEEAPNSSHSEGQARMDNGRELIAPDPAGSTFMGLPSSTAELSADPSWFAIIPNGHPQVPPQPQFAVPYDSNMDMNNQRAYSYRDVLPQDPALGQSWSQNTENNS